VSGALAVLDRPSVYRAWQAPFRGRKLEHLLATGDVGRARSVLDVACGPGTNAALFGHAEYLGIDINPSYVAYARRAFGRRFEVADVTRDEIPSEGRFDLILLNSFLHHLSDADAIGVLARLAPRLAPDGHVHIIDLVLPSRSGLARWLARRDRGRFARPLPAWHALFTREFRASRFEPFAISVVNMPLWHLVYFRGSAV